MSDGMTRAASPWYWIGLAFVGQAGLLAATDAGPGVGYQHMSLFWALPRGWDAVLAAALVAELGIVAWYLGRTRDSWSTFVRGIGSPVAFVLVVAVLWVFGSTLSADPIRFAIELAFGGLFSLTQLAALLIGCAVAPASVGDALRERWESWVRNPRAEWVTAAVATLLSAALAVVVYERVPHVPDEVSYLMGARTFANGLLAMPTMAAHEAFSVDLMINETDRWYSPVPPGWAVVLSAGYRFGVPWLVNPVLTGINTLLIHRIVERSYDRNIALAVAGLFCMSPWQLFLSMSFMTHTFSLTCGLVAIFAMLRWLDARGFWWLVAAGIGIGLIGWVRPLEGLIVAGVATVVLMCVVPRLRSAIAVAVIGVVSMVVGGAQLAYNAVMTGDPRVFPVMQFVERIYGGQNYSNALGFGANRGLGWGGLDPLPGHGPLDVLINFNLNLFMVNIELLGWVGGSIGFATLLVLVMRGRMRRADWAMVMAAAMVVGVHSLYWFSGGPDFGARYWFLLAMPVLVLTVRGLSEVYRVLEERGRRGHVIALLATLMAVGSATLFMPWRSLDKYRGYRGMRPGALEVFSEPPGHALVFVRGRRHPDYHAAVFENPVIAERGMPLFVYGLTPEIARSAVEAYPDRDIWIIDGPTLAGGAYEIRAGPMDRDRFYGFGIRVLGFRD